MKTKFTLFSSAASSVEVGLKAGDEVGGRKLRDVPDNVVRRIDIAKLADDAEDLAHGALDIADGRALFLHCVCEVRGLPQRGVVQVRRRDEFKLP